jgi:hypothetical protein
MTNGTEEHTVKLPLQSSGKKIFEELAKWVVWQKVYPTERRLIGLRQVLGAIMPCRREQLKNQSSIAFLVWYDTYMRKLDERYGG